MRRIFFVLLLMIYMLGCNSSQYKRDEVEKIEAEVYESPDQLIGEYYAALRRGDGYSLNELFIRDEGLRVERAIRDVQYRIVGSRMITEDEAWNRNRTSSNNKLQNGDLEVVVEEILNKNTEEITFILRRVNSRWKIYSHSIGYYI